MDQLPRLLLLGSSQGFGGGIERVAAAIEECWPGPIRRVDLYREGKVATPAGHPLAKIWFSARAMRASLGQRGAITLALHLGLLPVVAGVARATGGPAYVIAHGTEVWGPMPTIRRRLASRVGLVAVSRFTAEWLATRAGVDVDRVTVWKLPVDPALARAAEEPRAERPPAPPLTLLTVSRLVAHHRYKGHLVVAEAVRRLLDEGRPVRWVVVGAGDDLEYLAARCRELGIAEAVTLRGSVDEAGLVDAYRTSHVFVLPSVADASSSPPVGEGFGLVYAEAGAFGLPSIAARDGGGALDFVADEDTGLLVDSGDPAAVAAAVGRLADDPDLRERLGAAARRRVFARHLPTHFTAQLVETLAKMPAMRSA